MDDDRNSLLCLIADNDQDREEKLQYMQRGGSGSILEIADWFSRPRKSFLCWLVDEQSSLNESIENFIMARDAIKEGSLSEGMLNRHALEFFYSLTHSIGMTYLIESLCQAELDKLDSEPTNHKGSDEY